MVEGGHGDAQAYGDLPGVWTPGVGVDPASFGLTADEFSALLEGKDHPFVEATVEAFVPPELEQVLTRKEELSQLLKSDLVGIAESKGLETDGMLKDELVDSIVDAETNAPDGGTPGTAQPLPLAGERTAVEVPVGGDV